MSTAPPSIASPAAEPRRKALPRRRQLVAVTLAAVVVAAALKPLTHNPYIELLGETLFVGIMLLFAFSAAGAWRQRCCRPGRRRSRRWPSPPRSRR